MRASSRAEAQACCEWRDFSRVRASWRRFRLGQIVQQLACRRHHHQSKLNFDQQSVFNVQLLDRHRFEGCRTPHQHLYMDDNTIMTGDLRGTPSSTLPAAAGNNDDNDGGGNRSPGVFPKRHADRRSRFHFFQRDADSVALVLPAAAAVAAAAIDIGFSFPRRQRRRHCPFSRPPASRRDVAAAADGCRCDVESR